MSGAIETTEPGPKVTGDPATGPLRAQWPVVVVLVIFIIGMAIAATGHWRRAALLMGGATGLGGLLRLFLPQRICGLLSVRRRWIDVVMMIGMGAAMCVLAFVVPPQT